VDAAAKRGIGYNEQIDSTDPTGPDYAGAEGNDCPAVTLDLLSR